MNQFCQIEYGYSDSDIAMPCGDTAGRGALTAELRFVFVRLDGGEIVLYRTLHVV